MTSTLGVKTSKKWAFRHFEVSKKILLNRSSVLLWIGSLGLCDLELLILNLSYKTASVYSLSPWKKNVAPCSVLFPLTFLFFLRFFLKDEEQKHTFAWAKRNTLVPRFKTFPNSPEGRLAFVISTHLQRLSSYLKKKNIMI